MKEAMYNTWIALTVLKASMVLDVDGVEIDSN